MLGLTPAVWITEATVPRPDAVSNSRATASRSVTSQFTTVAVIPRSFSVGGRGIEPVLPDVAQDDGVVSADDLGRGQTHAARAARDHRYSTHIWTVYAEIMRYTHGVRCHARVWPSVEVE